MQCKVPAFLSSVIYIHFASVMDPNVVAIITYGHPITRSKIKCGLTWAHCQNLLVIPVR